MAFPTNIKTGFDNELSCLEKKELEINVTSSIMAFTEYAMKNASVYVEHSNRKLITVSDIKKALMIEVFNYFNRTDLVDNVQKWRENIVNETLSQEDDEEDCEQYCDENEDECVENDTVQNSCACRVCSEFKEIENKWGEYYPTDELGSIMKQHIDIM